MFIYDYMCIIYVVQRITWHKSLNRQTIKNHLFCAKFISCSMKQGINYAHPFKCESIYKIQILMLLLSIWRHNTSILFFSSRNKRIHWSTYVSDLFYWLKTTVLKCKSLHSALYGIWLRQGHHYFRWRFRSHRDVNISINSNAQILLSENGLASMLTQTTSKSFSENFEHIVFYSRSLGHVNHISFAMLQMILDDCNMPQTKRWAKSFR